jgi:hypothetical protein
MKDDKKGFFSDLKKELNRIDEQTGWNIEDKRAEVARQLQDDKDEVVRMERLKAKFKKTKELLSDCKDSRILFVDFSLKLLKYSKPS